MNVENLTVEKILSTDNNNQELFYKIPPYQREYAWGKEHWENLFNDLNDNGKNYFLGSIICIANGESSDTYSSLDVIDGQQRLVTLSILLNALLSELTQYSKDHPSDNILDMGENEEYALAYGGLKKLIFSRTMTSQKLTLSIQNNNDGDYKAILGINNFIKFENPANFGNRRISKAFNYFKNRLSEKNQDDTELFSIQTLFDFLEKILSSLIVRIKADDISSAFTLFESINNRGIPLTPLDLIKNSIIGTISEDHNETNERWQIIINNIKNYDDQVRYLRHYYHAFSYKEKVKLPKYQKAMKSTIIKIYSELIKKDVHFIFDDLIEKSKIYTDFINPQDAIKYSSKLEDLSRLQVAPAYSLLLHLFAEKKDENFDATLNFIENWFLRRHITDYPATNKLDDIFRTLITKVVQNSSRNYFEIIKEYLTEEKQYMNDEAFKTYLGEKDLYDINQNATRCLLIKLEKSKRTKETMVNFWETTKKSKGKLLWSVEHILPQKPNDKSDWKSIFTAEEIQSNVHRLGNLTLTRYNSEYSNNSFEKKSSFKDKKDKDIGLKSGDVHINTYLTDKNIWDKNCIEERGKILANEIITLLG